MQSLVSKATAEVKELRQSIDLLKAEVERMEVKYISAFSEVDLYFFPTSVISCIESFLYPY